MSASEPRREPRRRMGVVVALTLLLGLLGPSPARASHPACDPLSEEPRPVPAHLCGTVRLSGDTTGWVRVVLTEPATIDLTTEPGGQLEDIEIEGDGRIVGVILHRESSEGIKNDDQIRIIRMRSRGGSYYSFHRIGQKPGVPGQEACLICDLDPGVYRLYLLADGEPVSVTWRFPELHGEVDLSPAQESDYKLQHPQVRVDAETPAGTPLFSAGGEDELTGPGMQFRASFVGLEPGGFVARMQIGVCLRSGAPEGPAEPLAYLPSCPFDGVVLQTGYTALSTPGVYGFAAMTFAGPGTWGQGGFVEAAGLVHEPTVVAFWLPYG